MQNISDGAASQLVSKIGYGTLDAAITPGTVFLRQANNQSLYFFSGAGAPWSALLMPVVLLRDQFTVPSQQGIGCNQGRDFRQKLAPQPYGSSSETTALVIIETQSTITIIQLGLHIRY
jgi:hypothetical protein